MGHRELKRVPLDFDWPLKDVWTGYLNPYYKKCKECDGTGATASMRHLKNIAHLILLIGECARSKKLHPWLKDAACSLDSVPSEDGIALANGIAERVPASFGYDSTARWAVTRNIVKAAGLNPDTWGLCTACSGRGIDSAAQDLYNAWQPIEPPTGNGYQLWETTSEGSPVSPVFASAENLAAWCENNAALFADERTSKENWLRMFQDDSVGTGSLMVLAGGRIGTAENLGLNN